MKIICSKETLVQGLQSIQCSLSSRTTLPILLNFLMKTQDSRIRVASTDLEMGVKHSFPAEVLSQGSITMPAKKFMDILHSLPEGKEVELAVDGNKVHLKCGKSRFWIMGAPESDYPVLPDFQKQGAFQISLKILGSMVKRTVFAVSTDETRYVLNGVLWSSSKGDLEMVATDGRRLALSRSKATALGKDFKVIVPVKILQEVLKEASAGQSDEKVWVSITENQIAFQTEDTTLISRLIEGNFPSHEQVVPAKTEIHIEVPCKDLQAITLRASLCTAERGGSVKYSFKPSILQIHSSSQNVEFEDELPVNYQGKPFQVAFNPLYLLDFLKMADVPSVQWSFNTPLSPSLIEPIGKEQDYRYVVMPMRI